MTDLATVVVKEEHLPLKVTDDFSATECVSGDWSAEVRQENSAVVKLEPDDVCVFYMYINLP